MPKKTKKIMALVGQAINLIGAGVQIAEDRTNPVGYVNFAQNALMTMQLLKKRKHQEQDPVATEIVSGLRIFSQHLLQQFSQVHSHMGIIREEARQHTLGLHDHIHVARQEMKHHVEGLHDHIDIARQETRQYVMGLHSHLEVARRELQQHVEGLHDHLGIVRREMRELFGVILKTTCEGFNHLETMMRASQEQTHSNHEIVVGMLGEIRAGVKRLEADTQTMALQNFGKLLRRTYSLCEGEITPTQSRVENLSAKLSDWLIRKGDYPSLSSLPMYNGGRYLVSDNNDLYQTISKILADDSPYTTMEHLGLLSHMAVYKLGVNLSSLPTEAKASSGFSPGDSKSDSKGDSKSDSKGDSKSDSKGDSKSDSKQENPVLAREEKGHQISKQTEEMVNAVFNPHHWEKAAECSLQLNTFFPKFFSSHVIQRIEQILEEADNQQQFHISLRSPELFSKLVQQYRLVFDAVKRPVSDALTAQSDQWKTDRGQKLGISIGNRSTFDLTRNIDDIINEWGDRPIQPFSHRMEGENLPCEKHVTTYHGNVPSIFVLGEFLGCLGFNRQLNFSEMVDAGPSSPHINVQGYLKIKSYVVTQDGSHRHFQTEYFLTDAPGNPRRINIDFFPGHWNSRRVYLNYPLEMTSQCPELKQTARQLIQTTFLNNRLKAITTGKSRFTAQHFNCLDAYRNLIIHYAIAAGFKSEFIATIKNAFWSSKQIEEHFQSYLTSATVATQLPHVSMAPDFESTTTEILAKLNSRNPNDFQESDCLRGLHSVTASLQGLRNLHLLRMKMAALKLVAAEGKDEKDLKMEHNLDEVPAQLAMFKSVVDKLMISNPALGISIQQLIKQLEVLLVEESAPEFKLPQPVSSAASALRPEFGLVDVDVPSDNRCWFWSVGLSWLFQSIREAKTAEQKAFQAPYTYPEAFSIAYGQLFGVSGQVRFKPVVLSSAEASAEARAEVKEEAWNINDPKTIENVYQMLLTYDGKKDTPNRFEGGILSQLICEVFRNNLVRFMRNEPADEHRNVYLFHERISYSAKEGGWDQHLTDIARPDAWGGTTECAALACMLNAEVRVYKELDDHSGSVEHAVYKPDRPDRGPVKPSINIIHAYGSELSRMLGLRRAHFRMALRQDQIFWQISPGTTLIPLPASEAKAEAKADAKAQVKAEAKTDAKAEAKAPQSPRLSSSEASQGMASLLPRFGHPAVTVANPSSADAEDEGFELVPRETDKASPSNPGLGLG